MNYFIGTAGWSIPRQHQELVAPAGTHLERYASRFNCAEINSCFYRPHKKSTYHKWATSVPETFRFSVKVPKKITHTLRLKNCAKDLEIFLDETSALGKKRGVILVQLPPSLAFISDEAESFFRAVRENCDDKIVLEARHLSWWGETATELKNEFKVTTVRADPPVGPPAYSDFNYLRLHGNPRIYYSEYSLADLESMLAELYGRNPSTVWCIFDNTASGCALSDAYKFQSLTTRNPSVGTLFA